MEGAHTCVVPGPCTPTAGAVLTRAKETAMTTTLRPFAHRPRPPRRHALAQAAAACAALWLAGTALAADPVWPAKPLRIVVGFAPGGTTDVMARLVAKPCRTSWGSRWSSTTSPVPAAILPWQRWPVPRRTGIPFWWRPPRWRRPTLAVQISRAAGQGPAAGGRPGQNPDVPGEPPGPGRHRCALLVRLGSTPGKELSFASAGTGTAPHLACELFKQATKVDFVHAPYRGAAPACRT
jgi:hypothetical protein